MTNSSPDISFITICYNGFKDTCELIESLHKKLKSVSYEIIVVDNASREDEAAKIHELYPTVISIRSNENGGFSGGNNIGIRAAKGKYIFLINNDTYIESDEIAYLVERLESRPEIGGVSPKIRFAFPPYNKQVGCSRCSISRSASLVVLQYIYNLLTHAVNRNKIRE